MKTRNYRNGSSYAIAILCIALLTALGVGTLAVAWATRYEAIKSKNEVVAMFAAEAGYEKAIYWMSKQPDMLRALQKNVPGTTGSLNFADGDCDYSIELFGFIGARPVYSVTSNGHSGVFNRVVNVLVIQAISGWDMGMCRVAAGSNKTYSVYFADGEIIDMPLHINNLNDSPDKRDINIKGSPQFLQAVGMGESQHTDGGSDKYASVINLFDGGICFDQPKCKVTDEASVQSKVDRFEESTKEQFQFKPTAGAAVSRPHAAVQLEFFVDGGVGKVRITDDCTVRGFQQSSDFKTWDFKIRPGSTETPYQRYDIYGYHLAPDDDDAAVVYDIEQTYVTQSIGGVESEPGGQIFVDGDVAIGGDRTSHNGDQAVKGKITIVATGNIWIADSVVVDGAHDAGGKPSEDNPNVLGLVAQGVVKIVDSGMSDYSYVDGTPVEPAGFEYIPIGLPDDPLATKGDPNYHKRHLPDPMVVEAALTIGGGGWGAENIRRGSWGGRKEDSGNQDNLIVRGTIVEALRGVVGLIGKDGYIKRYYLDERLLQGILPGDIWLKGKYIPSPSGWHDYRS